MRLTSVVLHTDTDNEDIEFSVREGNPIHRYMIRSMVGIDADEVIPKYYARGFETDAKYHEYVMKPRDVVMRIALNPHYHVNEDVSDIRDEIYRLISSNRSGLVQLQFKSGGVTPMAINGMITKLEVPYFGRLPELQLTVSCPDPTFRSIHPIEFAPGDLPTGEIVSLPDGASTAPHGLSFKVEFNVASSFFVVQDDPSLPDWQFNVEPVGGFAVGDELHFSSEFGRKTLYHQKTVGSGPIMNGVADECVWPTIFPGNNVFHFMNHDKFVWLELSYYSAYWGI